MTTQEVIKFYKSQSAVARLLHMKQPSVSKWGDSPPYDRQLQLHILSRGALKADPEAFESLLGIKQ